MMRITVRRYEGFRKQHFILVVVEIPGIFVVGSKRLEGMYWWVLNGSVVVVIPGALG